MKLNWILLCFLVVVGGFSKAQRVDGAEKYWIFFTDKPTVQAHAHADILSERALERRHKQGIAVTPSDYPVAPAYLKAFREAGFQQEKASKWFNAVSSWLTPAQLAQVQQLPFVKATKIIAPVRVDYEPINTKTDYATGFTQDQIEMLGLDVLHQQGLMGDGTLIAVMDNGFLNVDINPHLNHLFTDDRVLTTYDFVNGETDVFDQGTHGAYVLSIIAGYYADPFVPDNNFIGSAPGATFILCHTEDDAHEWHREEDNWVAAMEFADSAGADIFTTSLGYSNGMEDSVFIQGQWYKDYTYSEFDGNTTIITRAADMAASKGILVLNSAGNSGLNKITAPADGDSVMAVGAVDAMEQIAGFSSRGPSFDGRIKPDISAMGQSTAFLRTNGDFSIGSGTSFSCPMMAGFAACLLQADPEIASMDLFQKILESADRYENPDTIYGYGIPDGPKAYELVTGESTRGIPAPDQFNDLGVSLFPNPAWDDFQVIFENFGDRFDAEISLVDMSGRRMAVVNTVVTPFYNRITLTRDAHFPNISQGVMVVTVKNKDTAQTIYRGKVRIME